MKGKMKKPVVKQPTQNDREIALLRNILACVFEIDHLNPGGRNTELRARALGLLEGMISYKEMTK